MKPTLYLEPGEAPARGPSGVWRRDHGERWWMPPVVSHAGGGGMGGGGLQGETLGPLLFASPWCWRPAVVGWLFGYGVTQA
jgi:hypothetical protein